jgi:hypothetical protein
MRSFDYARAPPEAGQGLVVFTVRLVLIVIYDNLWATMATVNGFSGQTGNSARKTRNPRQRG